MKANIISLALLFWAGLGCAQSEQYCNTDFGFCLEYPAQFSMLTAKGAADEPALFVADQGQTKIEIAGYANADNWSLEDIYYMNFEDDLRQNPDLNIIEEKFGEDQFEVLYEENDQLHYFRVQQRPGQYIKLSVRLPASRRSELPELSAQLSVQIPNP
ncbi:MAG: hypothetical protein RIC19_16580 [Phaeodactylibacter sp.]|uniref:hypothetical protein n=1 Tax=Phaeodactylibacter sp. TaxID=1940289 RepID=UPI0032F01071